MQKISYQICIIEQTCIHVLLSENVNVLSNLEKLIERAETHGNSLVVWTISVLWRVMFSSNGVELYLSAFQILYFVL